MVGDKLAKLMSIHKEKSIYLSLSLWTYQYTVLTCFSHLKFQHLDLYLEMHRRNKQAKQVMTEIIPPRKPDKQYWLEEWGCKHLITTHKEPHIVPRGASLNGMSFRGTTSGLSEEVKLKLRNNKIFKTLWKAFRWQGLGFLARLQEQHPYGLFVLSPQSKFSQLLPVCVTWPPCLVHQSDKHVWILTIYPCNTTFSQSIINFLNSLLLSERKTHCFLYNVSAYPDISWWRPSEAGWHCHCSTRPFCSSPHLNV